MPLLAPVNSLRTKGAMMEKSDKYNQETAVMIALRTKLAETKQLLKEHHYCTSETEAGCPVCTWLAVNQEEKP